MNFCLQMRVVRKFRLVQNYIVKLAAYWGWRQIADESINLFWLWLLSGLISTLTILATYINY